MPGFLSKIFRRKKEGGSTTKTKKGKQEKAPAEHATPAENNEDIPRQGSFGNTSRTAGGSNSSREKEALDRQNASWEQQRAMFNKKQQQQQQQQQTTSSQNHNAKYPPVVSHDENFDHSNNDVAAAAAISSSASTSPRLSYQQLQQFERQQRDGLSPHSGPSSGSGHQHQHQHQPLFTMSAELPRQQMNAMDDMNRSDASSSSFNLSTDAEDSEYEQLRRGGRLPGGHHHYHTSTLDTSNMSQISAPTAYTTDDDHIFPALQTDDDMTQATAPSTKEPSIHHQHHHHHHPPSNNSMLVPLQTPDDEPGRIQIFPMNNETEDDLRAWTISPSTQASKDPTSASSHQRFTFQGVAAGAGVGGGGTLSSAAAAAAAAVAASATPNSTSRNTPGAAHRNFTSPKSQASSNTDFSSSNNDDFANFADFSNFHSTTTEMVVHPHPWSDNNNNNNNNDDKLDPPTRDNNNNNGFDSSFSPRSNNNHPMPSVQATSTSTSNQDTSLSDLLAQAKNKSRRGSRSNNHRSSSSRQHSSSSVNSAPAITASYLRQHHNLGRYSTGNSNNSGGYGGGGDRSERDSRTSNEGTSVSDIIESLELTNQSRMKTTGRNNAYSHSHSVGDVGGPSSSIHAAKERLREKRRKEREYNGGLHKSRSSENSSSENSENEASESWLFDEVTGALGPRGIAADLESLSGRSNRSKNSQGNKSHKSHKSRSRRSRGGGGGSSSRRHTRSSNESVDSRGSRHSRNSRYSHRSTKSFISQMSEQSRSVANDLLRLEMQLAMVGSQENRDDVPVRGGSGSVQGGGGASIGGASRTSRTSRKSLTTSHRTTQPQQQTPSTIARRSKVTVVAPPGKLGIILANKADSKGTVVSGVRTSSVLAEKISPGDRIIAIDGEDVSRMTVSEITTIMSRKADYERCLTVLTTPKHSSTSTGELQMSNHRSPVKLNDGFDSSFQQHQYRR